MRILVIEDEAPMRQMLADAFKQQGYATDCAADGRDGLFMAREVDYDLAVIDLGLPKISGIGIIEQLRQLGKRLPILVLTARDSWQDKVEALGVGADDYVVKPFHMQEVLARVNALIRRAAGNAAPVLRFGPLALDTAARAASLNGEPMTLTSFEYNTLEYLAQHSGKVVSKTELIEHLYEQDFDLDSNVIEVFIGRLRKKIDPDNVLKPISTLRRQGYRFELQREDS